MSVDERLELEEELALERARKGLLAFTCYTKPDYQVNWHHRVMAKHLNAVARGEIKRLIITVPPRMGKSELLSVRFPAFMFGLNPKAQMIAASYNTTLSARMNRAVQRVMDTAEYQRVFPGVQLGGSGIVDGKDTGKYLRRSDEFEIAHHGGFYKSSSMGSAATGFGMTLGLLDDVTKSREEANSRAYQERLWEWYTSTFYSRLEKDGAIVLCMTRWSSKDLAQRLIDQTHSNVDADQWTVLSLPALCEDPKHKDDPRRFGEPLWPQKYSLKRMLQMKATMGSNDWASLYQQRPAPQEGGIVKTSWWQFYQVLPQGLMNWTLSVDLAFKDRGDYCCYQVWAAQGANRYLVDMVMERMEFIEQIKQFETLCHKWPQVKVKLVEDAANGAALVNTLKNKIQGIISVPAKGSKVSRAEAVAPQIESGNVFLPEANNRPWVQDFLLQWQYLPNGLHDDAVDAASMALFRMEKDSFDPSGAMGLSTGKHEQFYSRVARTR